MPILILFSSPENPFDPNWPLGATKGGEVEIFCWPGKVLGPSPKAPDLAWSAASFSASRAMLLPQPGGRHKLCTQLVLQAAEVEVEGGTAAVNISVPCKSDPAIAALEEIREDVVARVFRS